MPYKHEIAEQVQFERDAIKQGLERLRDNTKRLEESSYASASVYGCSSIDTLLPLVTKRIENTSDRIRERSAGQYFAEIRHYLADIEPLAAAAIALKLTFDKVFSSVDGENRLQNVTHAIGQALEQECQMRYYEREVPGLLNHIKKYYWHKSCGTHQKLYSARTLINRSDIKPWNVWRRDVRVRLGTWLLECIMEESGWFVSSTDQLSKRSKQNIVIPTPEFMAIKDQIVDTAEMFSPIAYPMLIEPNDWSPDRAGGYLLNEVMLGHDMIRRGKESCIQEETPYKFLNKIQKVGYRINPFVMTVAEQLYEKGIEVKKFIPIVEYELPSRPPNIDSDKDALKEWKILSRDVYNKRADSFNRSCRTRMTMGAARLFKDKKQFFIPWSFDYRGRAYPIPAFLTPQCTDFGKSLLKFSESAPITTEGKDWLAFQVATTYGLDKAPMHERLEWVANNQGLIAKVAQDPITFLFEWEAADEPWQFLAACEEYYQVVISGNRQVTDLPVATDATCSGLQILAGLCRCASTAKLVNVTPSDRPQDAYKAVADLARPNIPERFRDMVGRSEVKRVVMTIPYNAKISSNREYILKGLKDLGIEPTKEELKQTVVAVRDAVHSLFPGPMAVMAWIEKEVTAAIKRGETEVTWNTPSGFAVNQKLMKKTYERIQLQLMGKVNMRVATGDSDVVDLNHHKNATSPNLIHSLDASILHLSALRFSAPISLIHDSVLCRATDMALLSTIVREVYMFLFAENDFLKDWAQQIGAETEPPMINTLNPESVIESTYFFC